MANYSALAALKSGTWRKQTPGALGVAATIGALVDVLTTYYVLVSDGYTESNLVLTALAEVHVAAAVVPHAAFALGMAAVCWLSFGWLSSVAGWFAVLGFGLGGLNNAIGIWTGVWVFSLLPLEEWILTHYVLPVTAFAIGITVAYRRYGTLPPYEAGGFGLFVLGITTLPPVLL